MTISRGRDIAFDTAAVRPPMLPAVLSGDTGRRAQLTLAGLTTRRRRHRILAALDRARNEAATDRELAASDRAEAGRLRDEAAAMVALAATDE